MRGHDRTVNGGQGGPINHRNAPLAITRADGVTLFIAAQPQGPLVRVRVVDELFGAVLKQEFATDLRAAT